MYKMSKVESSNIAAIGYDPESKKLRIEFLNNTAYDYDNVPKEVHDEIMAAESHGKALNALVKKNPSLYPFTRIK